MGAHVCLEVRALHVALAAVFLGARVVAELPARHLGRLDREVVHVLEHGKLEEGGGGGGGGTFCADKKKQFEGDNPPKIF